MKKQAVISNCGNYSYGLSRTWDEALPKVLFIMLNPSTADANNDDPTIRRCINFAKSWGYGGIFVGNLFAYRCTSPSELLCIQNPVSDKIFEYELALIKMRRQSRIAICAWGNSKIIEKLNPRHKPLRLIDIPLSYLELSKDGTPKHPLYLRGDLKPKLFSIALQKFM